MAEQLGRPDIVQPLMLAEGNDSKPSCPARENMDEPLLTH
jgi:hypothetical protein